MWGLYSILKCYSITLMKNVFKLVWGFSLSVLINLLMLRKGKILPLDSLVMHWLGLGSLVVRRCKWNWEVQVSCLWWLFPSSSTTQKLQIFLMVHWIICLHLSRSRFNSSSIEKFWVSLWRFLWMFRILIFFLFLFFITKFQSMIFLSGIIILYSVF